MFPCSRGSKTDFLKTPGHQEIRLRGDNPCFGAILTEIEPYELKRVVQKGQNMSVLGQNPRFFEVDFSSIMGIG